MAIHRYTKGGDPSTASVYATVLSWPEDNVVYFSAPFAGPDTKISILGYDQSVQWTRNATSPGVLVMFPPKTKLATDWAWTIRFDKLLNY